MAISFRNGADVTAEMNSTPLIDVMLVLLVMLIITVPLGTHAVKLDIGASTRPQTPPPVVTVNVDFDGAVFWNGRAVDPVTLDNLLRNAAGRDPQPQLHVDADRLARYDGVAKVLADAQRLGIREISFVDTRKY